MSGPSITVATIAALAAIDAELGLPEDGCNSTARTLAAIRLLHSVHHDDVAEVTRLTAEHDEARIAELEAEVARWQEQSIANARLSAEFRQERDAALARAEAAEKEAARMDYVRKAILLDDDDAIIDFYMAETGAEFNAAIDGVLTKRTPVDAAMKGPGMSARCEATEKDAARYRWLRSESLHRLIRGPICIDADTWGEPVMACGKHITLDGADLDSAIDAAIAKAGAA